MAIILNGTTGVDLPSALTTSEGGTGLSSPGTSGYVLTSDGTNWVSAAPATEVPSQDGNSGKYLTTNGSILSWGSLPTFPNGTIVGTTDTQTLTNKTLTTPLITGGKETKVAMAANDVDLTAGSFFTKTISGDTTLTVSNVPSTGTVASFVLELTNGGASIITWWSNIKWAGGTAPILTSSGRDILGFFTHDAGTTWNGLLLSKDSK